MRWYFQCWLKTQLFVEKWSFEGTKDADSVKKIAGLFKVCIIVPIMSQLSKITQNCPNNFFIFPKCILRAFLTVYTFCTAWQPPWHCATFQYIVAKEHALFSILTVKWQYKVPFSAVTVMLWISITTHLLVFQTYMTFLTFSKVMQFTQQIFCRTPQRASATQHPPSPIN